MLCIIGAQPLRTGDSPEEGVTSHKGVVLCTQNVLFQRLDGLFTIHIFTEACALSFSIFFFFLVLPARMSL